MKTKYLIIVSLILAILTIGAVSANEIDEALTVDNEADEVSAIDETEDIDASVSDKVISDGENDSEDPFGGLSKDDFTVEIKSQVNMSNEDEYVVSYTCPKNVSKDSYIKIYYADEAESYPQFSTHHENNEPIKLNAADIGLSPFMSYDLHVYYCPSDEYSMEIASGTVSIIKTLDKYDFYMEYENNQVINSRRGQEILWIGPIVNGTFVITTDKGHKYEFKQEAYVHAGVFIRMLNITENGTYEINVKFIAEDGTEVDVTKYNITVDIDWNAPYDSLLDLQHNVNLLDKSSRIVQIDDEHPFVGKLTITIDDKQYYSKTLTKKDCRNEILLYDLKSLDVLPGNHTVTVEYLLANGEKHSIKDNVTFYKGIYANIPDRVSVDEEKYINIVCNESTGKVEVYTIYPEEDEYIYKLNMTVNITDGVANIPLRLSEGYYDYKVIVITNSCPDGVEFKKQIEVYNNSELYSFDINPKVINFGQNAVLTFKGNEGETESSIEIYVDDVLLTTVYTPESMPDISSDLTLGQHKIRVAYYNGDLFYSNIVWITVKEAPVPVDSGLELLINDVVEGTNVTIVVKTNSSFTGTVDVVIGNQTIPVAVSAGEGSANISLKSNSYEAMAIFKATDEFEAKNITKSFKVTAKPVVKVNPNLSIKDIADVERGKDVIVEISANESFSGGVKVQVGDVNTTATLTNGKGNVTVPTADFAVGAVLVKVSSVENEVFLAGNAQVTFNITAKQDSGSGNGSGDNNGSNIHGNKGTDKKPVTPPKADKITLTLKKVKVKKSAKKLVLQATLKINGKKAKKGTKVFFKFNGKKYTAKINAKGIAKYTIKKNVLKKLKVGKKIKYQVSYGKTIKKFTAKVKK